MDRIADRFIASSIALLFLVIVGLHLFYYLQFDGPKGIANIFLPRLQPGDATPEYEIHASPIWFQQNEIPVSPSYWLSYNFPLSRLPEFYIGVLTAKLLISGRWNFTNMRYPLLALAASYAMTWLVPLNFKLSPLIVLPTAAVIATSSVRDLSGRKSLNSTPVVTWLGDISYAFYLIQ